MYAFRTVGSIGPMLPTVPTRSTSFVKAATSSASSKKCQIIGYLVDGKDKGCRHHRPHQQPFPRYTFCNHPGPIANKQPKRRRNVNTFGKNEAQEA